MDHKRVSLHQQPIAVTSNPSPQATDTSITAPISLCLADSFSVKPGQKVTITASVTNHSQHDDHVNLQLQGLPSQWVTIPEETVSLPAGETVQIAVIVQPPRYSDTATGRQRFRLVLASQQQPALELSQSAWLQIEAYKTFVDGFSTESLAVTGADLAANSPAPAGESMLKPVARFARYTVVRLLTLFLAVVGGLYLTLMMAELGGKIDEVRRADIVWRAGLTIAANPEHRDKPAAERVRLAREMAEAMAEAEGLNRPIMIRVAEWMPQGLTLQLGESRRIRSIRDRPPHEQRLVRLLILERIPNTLLLLGVTNLLFFLASVWIALFLSRHYRSWLDKLFVLLSPLSTAPSWFYGLFLVAIFAGMLRWLPFGGMFPLPPPDSTTLYYLGMLERMILPFSAVFLSVFFYSVYVWRTFFLIYAGEDYVELAQAKGLSAEVVQRRYILRPTLPTILTSLVIMLIEIWGGSIILERLFNWPGLGDLYFEAIISSGTLSETGLIVGLTVVYAYFLAITIFVLDIAYAFLDPRIRVGSNGRQKIGTAVVAGRRNWRFWRSWPPGRPKPVTTRLEPYRPRRLRQRLAPFSWFKQILRDMGQALGQLPGLLLKSSRALWQLKRYPSAILGLTIIFMLLASIVYTVRTYPLSQAIVLWRGDAADWHEMPRLAKPAWVNYFSRQKLPENLVMDSRFGAAEKRVEMIGDVKEITLLYTFDFSYDAFPQEPIIYFYPVYDEKVPHMTVTWLTPDGRDIRITQQVPRYDQRHRFSHDERLMRRLDGVAPQQALFADPNAAELVPLQGEYQLRVDTLLFEEDADFDAKFIVHGQVYGLAGTDARRRDLTIALLWGVPIALSFGLLAALATTFLTMTMAAVGAWSGGWVDSLVQRLSEVNMVLPVFAILAMYTSFFNVRIWEVLGLAILFTIFGSAIKTYRALFLQVKESAYVEAAQAYGASNSRIVLFYLIPRVVPVLIPQIMILVPAYVFLEAGLAFLGLSDIYLPTWGKIINEAHIGGALLGGHYHWILQPAFLLMLTSFAFAMLGFALDRVFNPRLRER
jgi:peptide/nickel transport system permease protein